MLFGSLKGTFLDDVECRRMAWWHGEKYVIIWVRSRYGKIKNK